MALPKDVQDAVSRVDRSLREWRICQSPWQTIHAHLLSQDAELKILRVKCSGTLANNLCPDHRDKQVGNPCLACTIEKLQSRLAAANEWLEAAERGAARYRWLRDESLGQWEHPICVSQERSPLGMRYVGPLIGDSLDAAIDAATQEGEE